MHGRDSMVPFRDLKLTTGGGPAARVAATQKAVADVPTGMKLLVATDGSDPAERALGYALDLAAATDGSVTVVHSVDPDVYAETAREPVGNLTEADRLFVIDSVADAEDRGDALLADAAETAADRGVTVETDLLYGDPIVQIPEYVDDGDFDGVVVGHRGLSERVEELMGSVSKELVSLSDVPVTVVP